MTLVNYTNLNEYLTRAGHGDASAMFDVAEYFFKDSPGLKKKELGKGHFWLKRSVAANHAPAYIYMSEAYRIGRLGFIKDEDEADRILEVLALDDNIAALLRLGEIRLSALQLDRQQRGVAMLKQAFSLGSAIAGVMLAKNELPSNPTAAAQWIDRSIELSANDDSICLMAARLLISTTHLNSLYGWGIKNRIKMHHLRIEQDIVEQANIGRAIELLKNIAEQEEELGDSNDCVKMIDDVWGSAAGALARIYLDAIGPFHDIDLGQRWLNVAVGIRDPWAKYHLACLLLAGDKYARESRWADDLTIKQDARAAANLWHELSENENDGSLEYSVAASTAYAMCNIYGLGIAKDLGEAVKYLDRSCGNGDSLAHFELAKIYIDIATLSRFTQFEITQIHIDVSGLKNYTEKALSLASRSAALGHEPSLALRDRLAATLPNERVKEIHSNIRADFEVAVLENNWFVFNEHLQEIRKSYPLPWNNIK